MSSKYSVAVSKLIKDISLEVVYTPKSTENIYVFSAEVNRPGLVLTGFTDYFDEDRVEFLGLAEVEYLKSLNDEERLKSLENLVSKKPPIIIVTRNLECPDKFIDLAKKYEVPVLRSKDSTSSCMNSVLSYLNLELAERITRHGVLVEVSGEGILILGDSGVGKSETALELVRKGHRLIADDAVEIRKCSERTIVGSAPDNIRHFLELRGAGVINVRRTFGMGAVKMTQKIDMVIELEPWEQGKVYDRLGLEDEMMDILGVLIPKNVIPVKPGRNLSIIIEAAALNNRLKKTGYNAARELLHKLGMMDDIVAEESELDIWQNY